MEIEGLIVEYKWIFFANENHLFGVKICLNPTEPPLAPTL